MAGLLYGGNVVSSGIWVSFTGCVAQMANDNDGAWTRVQMVGSRSFFYGLLFYIPIVYKS